MGVGEGAEGPVIAEERTMSLKSVLAATAVILAILYVVGQTFSRSITTEVTIAAPPGAVWQVLTNGENVEDWNPFITQLEGNLQVGETLQLTVHPPGASPLNFSPKVLVVDENRELRWLGQTGFIGLFDGEHYFVLEEQEDGTTLLRHGEDFSGVLTYVLFAMFGENTEAGFREMNDALKVRVEAKS